ncbi:2-amino-4-hydroxy-6-hydroxymethyldihydropteridine diphosphokinase [Georgenia subflava]|uniref:2-amino-4-hydroxy-6- hydroxymethyldihydropteridine diphosphokinase n=1 Tax=Georgenia subflava TaxID=1622177 RepID=UPI001D02F3D8|nr:2-amino-4-hydroxy-6-hydroxymethyldihydropteridine diphosphokinase [Georgenia subflava]
MIRDADGRELDQIRVLGLSATGHHGVFAHERAEGQTFGADVVLHLDTRAAGGTDDLAATVSYADVAEDVVAILGGEPVDLVETLAARIADAVLARPGVHAVDVTVHKPQAPLTVPFDDVQLSIRRYAHEAGSHIAHEAGAHIAHQTADQSGTHEVAADRARTDEVAEVVAIATTSATSSFDGGGGSGAEPAEALERRPHRPAHVVLALGANIGDPAATLHAAVESLSAADGLEVTAVSPVARTAPVLAPGQDAQPDYLNAVVLATTTLAPLELLDLAHRLEDEHGRRREERWGARTLDIDIIAVDDLRSTDPVLTLPHPRAHERAFVLAPWAAADPGAVLPGPDGGPVAELADRAADRGSLEWVPGELPARGAAAALRETVPAKVRSSAAAPSEVATPEEVPAEAAPSAAPSSAPAESSDAAEPHGGR